MLFLSFGCVQVPQDVAEILFPIVSPFLSSVSLCVVFLCWQLASLVLAASHSCNSTHAQQCDAVRRLYVSLNLNYTGTDAWDLTADCCTYRGVDCDDDNVNVAGLLFYRQNGSVGTADASVLCHVIYIQLNCGFQFDAIISDFGGKFSFVKLENAVEWPRGMILDSVILNDFVHVWNDVPCPLDICGPLWAGSVSCQCLFESRYCERSELDAARLCAQYPSSNSKVHQHGCCVRISPVVRNADGPTSFFH
jgi:hypothetical protein